MRAKKGVFFMLWSFIISCQLMIDQYNVPADGLDTTEFLFDVPKGSSARSLGPKLKKEGIIDDADGFVNYIKLSKEGGCIKAGRFSLNRSMTPQQILTKLCGTPIPNDKPFTVVEGWRIREIDHALAKEGWIKAGEYKKLAENPSQFKAPYALPKDTLEGYLYPETYMITPDRFDAKKFIQRQIDMLTNKFYTPNKQAIKSSKRSMNQLVIMASMLEREEPTKKNLTLVSGILWKRFDEPCPSRNPCTLGVDATSHYTLENWNDRKGLLRNLKDRSDPYNSRLREGLPPTAIGSPSIHSLNAALNPKGSVYWYYLHDKNQILRPAKNGRGHEQNRRKYNVR